MNLYHRIRQWRYPREFRIAGESFSPESLRTLQELADALDRLKSEQGAGAVEAQAGEVYSRLATSAWRIRRAMLQPGTNQPAEEMRRAYRHVEALWDNLAEAGVEIRDHTGEPLPEHGIYALKVLTYEPRPGLTRETVIETIKPSVLLNGTLIQMGEVIVGIPG